MTAVVSLLYYPVALAWMLLCFTLMVLLWLVTAPFDKQRVAVHFLSRLWAKSFVWLNPLWSMEVKGAENIVKGGCYVITVNHQSLIDIPLMYAVPKLNFKWVAKSELYKVPIFGQVLRMHGDITLKRGSVGDSRIFFRKGLEYLSAGTSIMIFPEGTRSGDGEIHNFKEGAFVLAKEAGVEVLPCVLDGAKGFIKGWRLQGTRFRISILPSVPSEKIAVTEPRTLMNEVRGVMAGELDRMRNGR